MRVFSLCLLLVLLGTLTLASSNSEPTPAPDLAPRCDGSIEQLKDCHDEGCGDFADALLNKAKNRTDNITSGTPKTLDQIKAMPQPPHWNTGQARTSVQVPGNEGTAVEVKGFLLKVKPEGGESCNCGLTKRADTDVHFALVTGSDDPESDSVTAEVTPRIRQLRHPDWLYKNLNDFEGDYVKVVGLLMLDSKHLPNTPLQGERRNKGLVRATNWEIHPITRLWRCTKSKSACDHGNGWEEVN